jgi:hypothetical protein
VNAIFKNLIGMKSIERATPQFAGSFVTMISAVPASLEGSRNIHY